MEMKTVGEGNLLTACTGGGGGGGGWGGSGCGLFSFFCVARSPNPSGKKVKKVNACEQAKVTLGQGQNCQSK